MLGDLGLFNLNSCCLRMNPLASNEGVMGGHECCGNNKICDLEEDDNTERKAGRFERKMLLVRWKIRSEEN